MTIFNNNSKVALWGIGREGRSVLQHMKKERPVTVLSDTPLDSSEQSKLKAEYSQIQFVFTPPKIAQHLADFDIVVKSPGISLYREEVKAATRHTTFTSATNIWWEEAQPKNVIVVTGTKGKSTTASLLASCLTAAGFHTVLAGNIGQPVLNFLDETPDYWVLELSSYQISDLQYFPDWVLFLNLYPEHLDWHGSLEQYYQDKTRIANTDKKTQVVFWQECQDLLNYSSHFYQPHPFPSNESYHLQDDGVYDQNKKVLDAQSLGLKGKHNQTNIIGLLTLLKQLEIPLIKIQDAICSFHPLPHRLQDMGLLNGIRYINDSISTTPQSTLAALESFMSGDLVLIAGGQDRGLNWEGLVHKLESFSKLRSVVCCGESGKVIYKLLKQRGCISCFWADSMVEAVQTAQNNISAGTILLSPGAPSYGSYKNFIERGEAFIQAVTKS